MCSSGSVFKICFAVALLIAALALMAGSAFAASPARVKVMGPEDESKQVSATVWLNQHNKATLDALVKDMYDESSPNYHRFLTLEQYKNQFAPSKNDVEAVKAHLKSHNLTVTSVDPMNHFVMATGAVKDVQETFNVQINHVRMNGVEGSLPAGNPSVSEAIAPMVSATQISGNLVAHPFIKMLADPDTGTPFAPIPLTSPVAEGLFFSQECLFPPQTVNFTTGGTFPLAAYFGNRYGAPISNGVGSLSPCGYDPGELETAYGLNSLYKKGLNGSGQTVVIVDAFGAPDILSDANLFSSLYGLPALTTSGPNANFAVFTPNGSATCTATNGCVGGNWDVETMLDVEWAHAVAPGASIVLVLSADNSFTNLDIANLFAIENGFGNALSNSFGTAEIALVEFLPSELVVENGISEIAAALGINQDLASGDDGDELAANNAEFGINSVSVNADADSPFVTAVGGTSTFLDRNNEVILTTGWGVNGFRIANPAPASDPTVPPLSLGFEGGSGGGVSVVYAKPKFQRSLPGKFRLVPDIAMNADPDTGVEEILTRPGQPTEVFLVGGTSLAAPMFSGLWAIANQAAGSLAPLGQAAPLLYNLPSNAINDVNLTIVDTLLNPSGFIFNSPTSVTFVSADSLAQPLENTKFFFSALFQSPISTRWDVLSFGTDTSLATRPGWDNVTGLGVPNGEKFINAVVKQAGK
jgi:subtilase family serine protease